jgi:hypothetical protein
MAEWLNDNEIVKPIHNLCSEKDIHFSELNTDQYEQYVYETFNQIKSEEDAKKEVATSPELFERLDMMSESKSEGDAERANEYALEGLSKWDIPRRWSDIIYDIDRRVIKQILRDRGEKVSCQD